MLIQQQHDWGHNTVVAYNHANLMSTSLRGSFCSQCRSFVPLWGTLTSLHASVLYDHLASEAYGWSYVLITGRRRCWRQLLSSLPFAWISELLLVCQRDKSHLMGFFSPLFCIPRPFWWTRNKMCKNVHVLIGSKLHFHREAFYMSTAGCF